MNKNILVFLCLACNFLILHSQKSWAQLSIGIDFKGKVTSISDGSPVSGALILISGSRKNAITDENGNFEIKSISPGSYKIVISHLSYSTFEKSIQFKSENHVENFQLEESLKVMEEIVISGGFFSTREETPFKIESISGPQLQKSGNHNLMNAMSTIPGIYVISYGPGIGKPVIRGLSFSRIMTIYQGIRFENQQWGEEHGLGLNDLGVDRVEIIKGPASVLYGSGALGGVINIIDEKPFTDGLKGDFLFQGFSNTLGVRSNLGIKGGNQNGYFFNFRANTESHADYTSGNGRIIGNSRFRNSMIKAKAGIQKNWGSSTVTYTYNRQLLGIINEDEMINTLATNRIDRRLLIPYQEVTDHLLTIQNEIKVKQNSNLRFNLSHHVNLREENEEAFDQIDLGLVLNTSTYDLKYNFLPSQNTEMIIGAQGFRQSNINMQDARKTLLPDAVLYDNSVFGLISQEIHKIKIQGGLRFDHRSISANSRQLDDFILPGNPENQEIRKYFTGFTGSLGATYNFLGNLIFKANIASGFRAPDLAELFSNGEHPGTNRFEQGDVNFNREQNIETDLSLHYKSRNFSIEGASYLNLINNYIFFNPSDQFMNDLRIWKFEQDNVYLYGGELGVRIHPQNLKGFSSNHTFSMVRGLTKHDNLFLPFMPADRLLHEFRLSKQNTTFINNKYLLFQVQNVFSQGRIGENETLTPGYNLLSAGAGISTKSKKYSIDYDIVISNLLNTRYMDHMAITRQFDINNMGRNITFGVKFMF